MQAKNKRSHAACCHTRQKSPCGSQCYEAFRQHLQRVVERHNRSCNNKHSLSVFEPLASFLPLRAERNWNVARYLPRTLHRGGTVCTHGNEEQTRGCAVQTRPTVKTAFQILSRLPNGTNLLCEPEERAAAHTARATAIRPDVHTGRGTRAEPLGLLVMRFFNLKSQD